MNRLRDWGINALDELEDQIEEALEAEYRRGHADGFAEAADVGAVALPGEWDDLIREASWAHNMHHTSVFPMRQCSDPLCRRLSELKQEVYG